MDRAPEAVAGMGVIMPELGRARRGGGADKDEAEVLPELVGEAVQGGFGQVESEAPKDKQGWITR